MKYLASAHEVIWKQCVRPLQLNREDEAGLDIKRAEADGALVTTTVF